MADARSGTDVRMLLIDNYDSFTYNLVQAFAALGADVTVCRNDAITVEEALALAPTHLVISPGPGRPDDAGVSLAMIGAFAGRVPVLGVCLGHQSLVQHFGGEIVRADRLMHGKTSMATHDGKTIYEGLPQPFEVGGAVAARPAVTAEGSDDAVTSLPGAEDVGGEAGEASDRSHGVGVVISCRHAYRFYRDKIIFPPHEFFTVGHAESNQGRPRG